MRDNIKITPLPDDSMQHGYPVPPNSIILGAELWGIEEPEVVLVQKVGPNIVVCLQPRAGDKMVRYRDIRKPTDTKAVLEIAEMAEACLRFELTHFDADQFVAQAQVQDREAKVELVEPRYEKFVDLREVAGVTMVLEPEERPADEFVPRFGRAGIGDVPRPVAKMHFMTRGFVDPEKLVKGEAKGISLRVTMSSKLVDAIALLIQQEVEKVSHGEATSLISRADRAVVQVKTIDEKTGERTQKPEFKIPTREEIAGSMGLKLL